MSAATTEEHVAALEAGVDEFANEYVGNKDYRPRWPNEPKIVHDALWGTIRLHPWEIALLDLPLFQRLRQISQTSLVNYVFPGCRHSRFEHTLGVIHQTQKLAEAVNDQCVNPSNAPFDRNTIRNLRIAALFHDCGHSCFSHVSENVYRHLPDMQAIATTDAYKNGNPHEILSALILKSDAVRNYFDDLSRQYRIDFRIDEAAGYILGEPPNKDFAYVAQVINGPFDADKLDYLFRDAHFSGLPLSLDLDRLWASCDRTPHPTFGNILTLRQSSVVALEQILFSKINLFSVVYQHPKVRAAECMFEAVIDQVRTENGNTIADRRLQQTADFLWLTDSTFFGEALRRDKTHALHKAIHDIVYRRYLVRALTISKDTCAPSKRADYHELRILNHRSSEDRQRRQQIAREIWDAAGKPCDQHEVVLDLPSSPTLSGADNTYVRVPTDELRVLTDYFPINYWNESYISNKWRGHVFCPPHCQQEVYVASKKVLKKEFNLTFKPLAGAISHVPVP